MKTPDQSCRNEAPLVVGQNLQNGRHKIENGTTGNLFSNRSGHELKKSVRHCDTFVRFCDSDERLKNNYHTKTTLIHDMTRKNNTSHAQHEFALARRTLSALVMTLKTRRNRGEFYVPTDRVAFDYTLVHQEPLSIPNAVAQVGGDNCPWFDGASIAERNTFLKRETITQNNHRN